MPYYSPTTPPMATDKGTRKRQAPLHQSSGIFIILKTSAVLSYILPFIEWENFYSLSNTCKACHLLVEDAALRDAILSRYVPWYSRAIRLRDPLNGYKDVPVSLKDLDLLRKQSTILSWLPSLVHNDQSLPSAFHFINTLYKHGER